MSIPDSITNVGLPSRPRPRPNRPLPFDDLYDYGDYPPEEMELDDVESIWWSVASTMSKKTLRSKLAVVVKKNTHTFGCYHYVPISDAKCRGRYPRGVIRIIKEVLKRSRAIGAYGNRLSIQSDIWHEMTRAALEWIPVKSVPKHLRGMRLEAELGL
jgi:hypothetical protein